MYNLNINLIFPENFPSTQKSGIIATAINAQHKYQNSGISNERGRITIPIPNDKKGKYQIIFNNPHFQKCVINLTHSMTIQIPYTELVTYTIRINESTLDYTYLDDAIGMTPGALWNEQPIFNSIVPCLIDYNESIMELLDFQENPIRDFETYQNLMIKIPQFAYKIKRKDNYLYVSITNNENKALADPEYSLDAFSKDGYGSRDAFYIGAYKGYIDEENQLRSISGQMPTVNHTLLEFKLAAQTNGTNYGITTYAQLKALQCLYLIKYGPNNTLGKGICSAPTIMTPTNQAEIDPNYFFITGENKYSYTNPETGELATEWINNEEDSYTDTEPLDYGTMADGYHHMKLFGIEDFWGNIFEWIDGFIMDENNTALFSPNLTNDNLVEGSGTYLRPISLGVENYEDSNQFGAVTRVIGTTEAGFLPIEFNSQVNTKWSEFNIIQRGCNLAFGGMWNMQDKVGPFCFAADVGENYQYRSVGARLTYMP